MPTVTEYSPIKEEWVEYRHYGRHPWLDVQIKRLFTKDEHREKAWHWIAVLRKHWPWFMKITQGPLLYMQARRIEHGRD